MTRRRPGQTVVLLTVLTIAGGVVVVPAVAAEKTGTERAREFFQHGEAFFKLEKYKEALSEYEQGYLAKSDASFLYNIAQCHRLMGNKSAALRFYRRFLTEATRIPNREMVEQHIRDLEKAISKETAAAKASAKAPPSDAHVEPAAPPPTVATHPVASPPEGAPGPAAVNLSAPPPAPAPPALAREPAPGPADSSDTPPPVYERWWFWTAIGAVLVAGGVTALLVLKKDSACEAGRICM